MKSSSADVVICGAGIGGVSAAYHLAAKQGIKKVLIVDERSPFTLTSDKSTEAYRNWWPGPGDTMVRFMNRSIDLLENLARESNNFFRMNRRGYVFLTADHKKVALMEQTAREISRLGAGPVRRHQGRPGDPLYSPSPAQGFDTDLTGADLVTDRALIRKHFPFISDRAIAMLHPRRCGWLSAQQLGMYLLERAREHGMEFLKGRVLEVDVNKDRVEAVRVRTEDDTVQISTRAFVIAAGPLLKTAGNMIGIDLPVFNELHGKIAFNDPAGVISRDAPLMIWTDPAVLPWTEEERNELAGSGRTKWLLDEFPGGVHFRPEGGPGSQTILALWTYDIKPQEPVWPPVFEPEYAEVVLRGMGDGGYYCKTRENRPLIGPLPVKGAFVMGALSGFGIMASMAGGELLGIHVAGGKLPDYAPSFLLSRYEDPAYRKLLSDWDSASGQL
jgi:glycine/D-amino acid oxidase-like deaminating enzyme